MRCAVACHAALLLAEEIEPEDDAYALAWSGGSYGDRTLELLGRYRPAVHLRSHGSDAQ